MSDTLQERVDRWEAAAQTTIDFDLVEDLNTERLRLEAENKRLNKIIDGMVEPGGY